MGETVAVPVWLLVPAALLASWAAVDRLLLPAVRWIGRRRADRALEEADRRLLIRVQPFKLAPRRALIDRLVHDPEVAAAADRAARQGGLGRRGAAAAVEEYAREIVPAFNAYVYFRFGHWLTRRLARTLYRVRLGAGDEEALSAVDPRSAVVFVMNHRSNMDYLLLSHLVAGRTALSFAAGEWARVWPLEPLIRSLGAYFVRRRSNDPLYRQVLARYVHLSTREGVTQAVFPEGGLSRDGRLCRPKLGLVDYMLRGFDPAVHRDVVFVPVGINYDRVLEDRTLLLGMDPKARPRHPLKAAATTAGFLGRHVWLWMTRRWYRFGYAAAGFGRPLSARAWLAERGVDLAHAERTARFAAVESLAGELMERIRVSIPALPVSLVASVLVERPEVWWGDLELKAAVQRRIGELEAGGGLVYIPRRSRDYAVEVGLRMLTLRRLVEMRDGLYRPRSADLAVLRYYASVHRPAAGPAEAPPAEPRRVTADDGRLPA